jgi:hypothetical protein
MSLTMCSFQSEDDYWRIRHFLREVPKLSRLRGRWADCPCSGGQDVIRCRTLAWVLECTR